MEEIKFYSGQSSFEKAHLLIFAMPRSATHFTAKFIQLYFEAIQLPHYMKFRTFRNFKSQDEQVAAINESLLCKTSVFRITCPEETENIERYYGLQNFFSERTAIIINPRSDLEDLVLARIIPYYHWTRSGFDGLRVPKKYYSFCDSGATWSPYGAGDISELISYYRANPIPFDLQFFEHMFEVIMDFISWFAVCRRQIRMFSHVEFFTDDFGPNQSSSDGEVITYGPEFTLLQFLNQLFGAGVERISLGNMKQQTMADKYCCFSDPENVKSLITSQLNGVWGGRARDLIHSR